VFAAVALIRPHLSGRASGWIDRHAPVAFLVPPLIASATVAIAASRDTILAGQWWWLSLWLASVAAVPLLAGASFNYRTYMGFARRHRNEILLVAALTALGAVARFVRIDSLPSPYAGDEATFALGGMLVIDDRITNPFIFGAHGAPSLYFYYVAAFEKAFGVSPAVVRSSSAVLGVIAIPVTYVFIRDLFNRAVAICGALFLAAFHFHIQYSRESMPNILDPIFIPLVLLFCYRAMRDGRRIDYAMAGLTLGLTLYTWISARLIPLEVAALAVAWIVMKRRMPVNWIEGGVVALAAALVAAAPLGWYSYHHQDEFNTRLNEVGIHRAKLGDQTWYEATRAQGRSGVQIYKDQFNGSFETVLLTREKGNFYGANIPLIGTATIVPLLAGLAWALWRVREPRYFLALVLFVAPIIAGGVLTVGPPASSARLLGVIPAVALLVGLGAERIGVLASRRPALAQFVAIAVVVPLAIASLNFYFRLYDSKGYSDATTLQIEQLGEDVRSNVPKGAPVYFLLTDAWNLGHPALNFALRDYPVTMLDAVGAPVLTVNPRRHPIDTERVVAFLFTKNRIQDVDRVVANCPGGTLTRPSLPNQTVFPRAIYVLNAEPVGYVAHPCLAGAATSSVP
jgi:4-amino-4-deoxy-L-arabinose transferase-like glycosyltransferase